MVTPFGPGYLSENSFILGVGVSSKTWHHLTGWAEAGSGDELSAEYRRTR